MSVTHIEEHRADGDGEPDPERVDDEPRGDGEPDDGEPGGTSIEDALNNGAAEEDDDGTPQLVLPGTGSALSTSVGGRKPTESLFKMSGVSLPIAGGVQLAKDSELWIAVPVAIDDVRVRNRRKDREIVSVARVHTAIAIGQPVVLDAPPPGVE